MVKAAIPIAAALAMLSLSGCFGGEDFFTPGQDYKETGRTVDLTATVVDYDKEVYPGLKTWLWAFCFKPTNPNDAYSAAAIDEISPREGDGPASDQGDAKCGVPGPTLRVKQGDRVKVTLTNSHFHPHTIHWHGQFVPWESDGAPGVTQDSVESGGSYTYDFIAKRAGTLWYHCHVDTQFHLTQGLYGMMIVDPQDTSREPKDIDREYVMILGTMNRNVVEAVGSSRHSHPPGCASGFPGCENPSSLAGKPDVFLINGYSFPYTMDQEDSLYVMKPGERIRLRILNTGETVEEIHPHGHDMLVTHKDGNPIPRSAQVWQDTLKIGPAERYDVVIEANNPGPWMVHTHVSSHETNCGKSPGGMHSMIVYEEYLDKMHEFKSELPASCAPGSVAQLPGDFANSTSFSTGTSMPAPLPNVPPTSQPFAAEWEWPLQLPCAVRKMSLWARLVATGPGATTADIDVAITAPDGAGVETLTLTSAEPKKGYVLEGEGLRNLSQVKGNYTVQLSGSGIDAIVELDVNIDYYETFEQSKVGHLTYKVGGCTGFT